MNPPFTVCLRLNQTVTQVYSIVTDQVPDTKIREAVSSCFCLAGEGKKEISSKIENTCQMLGIPNHDEFFCKETSGIGFYTALKWLVKCSKGEG